MKEIVLKKYFEGSVPAEELAADVRDARQQVGPRAFVIYIEDMQDEDFRVTNAMAVQLCKDVLRGAIPPALLQPIGFALIASDKFTFDGDEIEGEVIHDWAGPKVNLPLHLGSVERFRKWLSKEEPYPEKKGLRAGTGEIISITEKRSIKPA
jgi:hypothetical protein